jgi:hypothetical protein
MKIIILAILLFLTACGSTDVTLPTRPEHAPKDYKPKGMVKYNNAGMDSVKAKRKEDAFKRMSDNCNGKYKVLDEGAKAEGGIVTSGVLVPTEFWYISYECLD